MSGSQGFAEAGGGEAMRPGAQFSGGAFGSGKRAGAKRSFDTRLGGGLSSRMPAEPRHYFKELRLQQFRSLVALARWQTFSAAAAALKITRASVWQQVRSLEQEMGSTLVRTRAQRVELTPAGQRLVEIAAPLVAGFDSAKSAFQAAIDADAPQTLAIAASPSFLQELREPIARIHALHPNLHVTFLERNSAAAVELLDQGGADLAIAAKPDNVTARAGLEYTRIATYPFTLIFPPQHPLLAKKRVTLRDLMKHRLILPGGPTYCRQHFNAVVAQAGLQEQVNVAIESNFPVMLFEYVRLGLGVSLSPLPRPSGVATLWEQAGVILRDAEHLFGSEPIYFVRRKGQFETPYAARFRELVTSRAVAAGVNAA